MRRVALTLFSTAMALAVTFDEACKLLDAGKSAQAMEAFTKIAGDTCYEGKYKGMAKAKLQEMKDAWNKRD